MTLMKHCCVEMKQALDDPDTPIYFLAKYREYAVAILDGGSSGLSMLFCPWCGIRLPGSLRSQWFEVMEKLDIDPETDKIPEKYTDERWYCGDSLT